VADDDSPKSSNERFRAAYWRAWRDLDALRLQQWEQSNLTLPQLRVLYQVRRSPGITSGELARILGITMSTSSGLVAKLVDAGLVVRGVSEDDRRQIPLEITEAGQQLAGELSGATRPFVDSLAKELGTDLDRVTRDLEALIDAAVRARPR